MQPAGSGGCGGGRRGQLEGLAHRKGPPVVDMTAQMGGGVGGAVAAAGGPAARPMTSPALSQVLIDGSQMAAIAGECVVTDQPRSRDLPCACGKTSAQCQVMLPMVARRVGSQGK